MELTAERLAAVRADMAELGLDALVVPRADEYLGEYIPERNERLRWLSGFTGSAGVAVVMAERAALFVDGRYTVQVRRQVDPALFEILHLLDDPHMPWLAGQLEAPARVGFDPRMHSLRWYRSAQGALEREGVELVELERNLIDRNWTDRPEAAVHPAILLPETYTGADSAGKRRRIGAAIAEAGAEAALVFAADSVAWLLNIRGHDVPCLPLVLGFGLLHADARMLFFTDPAKIPADFHAHVGEGVEVLAEAEAPARLAALKGRRVIADPATANAWCQLTLERAGAELVAAPDPVLIPKACKNEVEISGIRRSHVRDGVAEVRFLAWLDAEVAAGRLRSEGELSDRLLAFRAEGELFQETSFDTISAAAGNAAMCHYNHLDAGEDSFLELGSVYLVDSGGQYLDGTTDVTRTVAIGDPGAEVRRHFTLVLKGHIALAQAVFPPGTEGARLDILARQFLWREGLDYDHGTGHGVGAFLSVHEGPQRISKSPDNCALRPGMVLSNEPGYYKDSAYGIRCENLMAVRESGADGGDGRPMLEFETLTLAPFDARLLDVELLTSKELDWLNDYHALVREKIGPHLEGDDLAWLERATQPIVPASVPMRTGT